jgi:hypothetical protein
VTRRMRWRPPGSPSRSFLLAQRTAEVIPTVAAVRTWPSEVVDLELQRLDVRATRT